MTLTQQPVTASGPAIGCHLDRDTFDLARSLGFSVDETQCRLFASVRLAVAQPPARSRVTLD